MAEYDPSHTFVTSDYHFRDWTHFGGLLAESTKEEETQHIELWRRFGRWMQCRSEVCGMKKSLNTRE